MNGVRGRRQEADPERGRGDAARPAELVEDRREEEREGRAGVHGDPHRDGRGGHDDPAVKTPPPPPRGRAD